MNSIENRPRTVSVPSLLINLRHVSKTQIHKHDGVAEAQDGPSETSVGESESGTNCGGVGLTEVIGAGERASRLPDAPDGDHVSDAVAEFEHVILLVLLFEVEVTVAEVVEHLDGVEEPIIGGPAEGNHAGERDRKKTDAPGVNVLLHFARAHESFDHRALVISIERISDVIRFLREVVFVSRGGLVLLGFGA